MNTAWEITECDVATVVKRHNIPFTDTQLSEWNDLLDHDYIINGLLNFTNMEAQVDSMLEDIEDALMEAGVIPKGEKKFVMQDQYDEDDE